MSSLINASSSADGTPTKGDEADGIIHFDATLRRKEKMRQKAVNDPKSAAAPSPVSVRSVAPVQAQPVAAAPVQPIAPTSGASSLPANNPATDSAANGWQRPSRRFRHPSRQRRTRSLSRLPLRAKPRMRPRRGD